MKKILKFFLLLLVCVYSASNTIYGDEIEEKNTLVSEEISNDFIDYAHSIFPAHMRVINSTSSEKNNRLFLGEPFTVFNVCTKENVVFFPIVKDYEIVLLMEVTYNNEFSSSVSDYFAPYISSLFDKDGEFALITDGVNVAKCSTKGCETFYSITPNLTKEINIKFSELNISNKKTFSYDDLLIDSSSDVRGSVPDMTVLDEYTLDVDGVSQGSNTCWAATCAALINYYKGTSLSWYDVASYVFPSNPDQGGNWTNIRSAYNHWSLYPNQTGPISFSLVRSYINVDKPLHLGLTGHSVGLIGFSWVKFDNNTYDRILVLLEPNGGVIKTVTLKANDNFNYYLTGNDSWLKTRYF